MHACICMCTCVYMHAHMCVRNMSKYIYALPKNTTHNTQHIHKSLTSVSKECTEATMAPMLLMVPTCCSSLPTPSCTSFRTLYTNKKVFAGINTDNTYMHVPLHAYNRCMYRILIQRSLDNLTFCRQQVTFSIQWNLDNLTLCGQQNCVRLQRLSDYQEIPSIVQCGNCTSQ